MRFAPIEVDAPLPFADAIGLALERSPTLRRLRSAARAAEHEVPGWFATLEAEELGFEEGGRVALTVDPLVLLGSGRIAAGDEAARRRAVRAWAGVRSAELEVERTVATAYKIDAALASVSLAARELAMKLPDPTLHVEVGALSATDAEALRATIAAVDAFRTSVDAARRANLETLRAPLCVLDGELPRIEAGVHLGEVDDSGWLRHPAVVEAFAAYAIAEAELRVAAVSRYPQVALGPEVSLGTGGLSGAVQVTLPLRGSAAVAAAEDRREAARAAVHETMARVRTELSQAGLEHVAAQDVLAGARRQTLAEMNALRAVAARAEVDPFALNQVIRPATDALSALRRQRDAAFVEARRGVDRFFLAGGRPGGGGS